MVSVKRFEFFLLLGVFFIGSMMYGISQDQELRSYPVFPDALEAAIETVRTIVGDQGKVIYNKANHQILVFASESDHKRIEEAINTVNRPPKMIRIEVQNSQLQSGRQMDAGLNASGVIVRHSDGTSGRIKIRPHLSDRSYGSQENAKQILVVSSGRHAYIDVGEEVPYREWFIRYGREYGYLEEGIVYRFVGARLAVQPTVVGNGPLIVLKLIPELSALTGDAEKSIRFIRAATELTVQNGMPLTLGGFSENKDFYDRFLTSLDRGGNNRQVNITVTATIVE